MKLFGLLLLAPFASIAPQSSPAPQDASHPSVKPADVYDESADASTQIDAALARAKKDNKRVLVQWGANWCSWCRALHGLATEDATVRKKLLYEYEVVLVDVGHFDKHMDVAARLGADFKKSGIPYLTILDAEGKTLANRETGPLETNLDGKQGHDPKKVVELLTQFQAPALVASEVRAAALARAKQENKRVFEHFGAPWCGWCHKLEGWMARPEVAALLAKEFVDLKIDVDRMTGGAEALAQVRTNAQGGIPWFALLDAEGTPLATSDGPGGNVGCPYEDDEIAYFATMLGKARLHLTDAEIETLRQSMLRLRQEDEARKAAAGAHAEH